MNDEYGPYRQMGILGEQMAKSYQIDTNLELEPHLAHYMEEVEVNIASDKFNHVGFMEKILGGLQAKQASTVDTRAQEFLDALITALQRRIGQEQSEKELNTSLA